MVAVKRLSLVGLKEQEIAMLMKEVDILKTLSHPRIVKYEGVCRDETELDIILEYVLTSTVRCLSHDLTFSSDTWRMDRWANYSSHLGD